MKKKIFSIILAVAMLACMIPVGTLTAFAGVEESHTHVAGTAYMTDGRAYWRACDDEDCPLNKADDPVLAYEVAFSSYEGPALKAELYYHEYDEVANDILMGRQGRIIPSGISKEVGRTIIGLTESQLANITSKLIIVGCDDSDNNTQVEVEIDHAYTYFRDTTNGQEVYVQAQACKAPNGEQIAAFAIFNQGIGVDEITGYGYYRVYHDTVDDSNLLGEAIICAPRTFKAVYDTTDGANTLNFYFDTEDHSGENKTVYENTAVNPTGLYDSAKTKQLKWGYSENKNNIKDVSINPTVIKYKGLTDTSYMFYNFNTANSFSGAEYLDVSKVTDISYMFHNYGFSSMTFTAVPDVSHWNTANVKDLNRMFARYAYNSTAISFNLNLLGWDISNTGTYEKMFDSAGKNADTWQVTIPAKTGNTDNTTTEWYVGDGTDTGKYIAPAEGREFTVAQ